ncbi:MAG: UDP-2,3-diacylglucosamine diphosphatase LpxI [Deltaproteobacteria bacterium]|nr:MAG: UDP-2,3-diacylglucosamine diphosphatase LpxI [Deltaproteobacteria bacterium]
MTGNETDKIGIIAGGGQFPLLFAKAVHRQGLKIYAAAHQGETDETLTELVDRLQWVKLGQLGKIINFFKEEGVKKSVFIGSITKTNIFRDVRPDLKGLGLWNKIDIKQDDAILRAVADRLEKDGIEVVASTSYVPELLFPQGILSRKKLTKEQKNDIIFGWKIARSMGSLDIGQCVVVRNQTVLAVEAIEGTDAAIRRGGSLGKEKAVVVKLRKPNQDLRFDLPAVGEKTIASMQEVNAAVLAVEAGYALFFDREAVIRAADAAGIVIVGVTESASGELSF